MTNLLAARLQMAFSLGFHMIFAEISAALPVMVPITEAWNSRVGTHAHVQYLGS